MPRLRSYHLHLPFYHLDDTKNLRLLYVTRILRDLVNKVSLFFLPIFLFELGKNTSLLGLVPVSEFQRGMLAIGIFYLLSRLISLVIAIPIGRVIQKIGHQRSFTYGYLLRVVAFTALFFSTQYPLFLFLAVVCEAVQTNLFWNTYHTVLSKNTLKTHVGQDLGILQFCLQVISVITPGISGVLAYWFGLEMLFLFGILGTLLAFVFSLQMKFSNDTSDISFSDFKAWMRETAFEKLAIAQAGRYIHDSILFLWPLYVFFVFGSIEKVGYLYTISLFLVLIVTVFMGVFIDKTKTKRPFYLSGGVLSMLWLARTQVISIFGIALVDAADKLLSNFHWLYYDMVYLRRGKGSKALAYFVYGEMINSIAGSAFWLLFCIFFSFYSNWDAIFIFGAISVVMTTVIGDKVTRQLTPDSEIS